MIKEAMPTMSQNILEVKNLSNHYEDQPLLQNINFSLDQGEILCLLGPSGSGKTTLLRLLAGLEQEDCGVILFKGKNISTTPPHKRSFGMMFQEYALFPHKTVQQNVAFGLEMLHYRQYELDEQVQAMLDLVGLRGFEDRKIDELSGGERQRVALARSLAPGPQLLLLDEPLGSLDRTLRDRLAGEIRTILKSLGVTAVFVTHDQAEAFSVADKVAILHHGILQQFATPENLYRAPENSTVARFLGFRNLIEGYLDGNDLFHSPLGKLPIIHPAETMQKKVKLLIRPEGATLDTQTNNRVHLSGIVNDCRFQGSSYKLTLTVNGIELIFDLPIDPVPPQVGQQIDLNLCSSALVLIND
jgi:ABC-type Fe3+/spermidine/putrescine transport system ATPase subunit